jgi:hypothetical protein
MDETEYITSEASFSSYLQQLRHAREKKKQTSKTTRLPRQLLLRSERAQILAKTDGHCHICGGLIGKSAWQADHVLAHSAGGQHHADNYLPAHALCNNYRWDYSAEEFQLILKLGVWMRTQMELGKPPGRLAATAFLTHERARRARHKVKPSKANQATLRIDTLASSAIR